MFEAAREFTERIDDRTGLARVMNDLGEATLLRRLVDSAEVHREESAVSDDEAELTDRFDRQTGLAPR